MKEKVKLQKQLRQIDDFLSTKSVKMRTFEISRRIYKCFPTSESVLNYELKVLKNICVKYINVSLMPRTRRTQAISKVLTKRFGRGKENKIISAL